MIESEFSVDGEMPAINLTEWMRGLYFKRSHAPEDNELLNRELVNLVIDHARKVVSHPSRPMQTIFEDFVRAPHGELALEETFEENPFLSPSETLTVELSQERPFSCVAMLDSSSSMTGEKHLLSSVAVAVLFLKADPRLTSLVLFSSKSKVIKKMGVDEKVENTLLRFLKTPPRGFTNITAGLEEGLRQFERRTVRGRKVGILATDGRATEGGDPLEAARKFDYLVVLHLHGPGSHLETSREIAQQGRGLCLEVERFEELPNRLYDALRLLSRL